MSDTNEQLDSLKAQGASLMNANRLEEARAAYTEIVKLRPEDAETWYALSNINGRLGRMEDVAECARRAIAIRPDFGEAHVNLGHVYLMQGRHDQALDQYRTAVAINPASPMVYFNMGNILKEQDKPEEAAEAYRRALHYEPSLIAVHNNLGTLLYEQGDYEQAAVEFRAAWELEPGNALFLNNFGKACRTQAQFDQYLQFYRKAVETLPDPKTVRLGGAWLDNELQACYSLPGIDYRPLTHDSAQLLKIKHEVSAYIAADNDAIAMVIDDVASDPLFVFYLQKSLNVDAELEIFLTRLRRSLLLACRGNGAVDANRLSLLCSLAHQGASNEYVFSTDHEEHALVDELRDGLERAIPAMAAADPDVERKLCLFAMYDGLHTLACRDKLGSLNCAAWSPCFRSLLDKTLWSRLEEERIKLEIQSLGAIEDKVSQAVRAQYEENPYPRWLSLPDVQKIDFKRTLVQFFPHYTPSAVLDGPIEILIAGCGTGKQPIREALTYKDVNVLAIDISKSSLAYAIRMARKYGATNIRFMQGDILQLASVQQRFPVIECSGVLHHMDNPLAGWKVLCDLLEDGGVMSIGLYSETARHDLNATRDEFAKAGLAPTRDNIRKYRSDILTRLAHGEIEKTSILNNDDFYSTSGCRDLLFHVQEHRFTIPKINEALQKLGLTFIGFKFPATQSGSIKKLYLRHFPDDREMNNLAYWERFEEMYPNTFSLMYQFWCQKN
jgi:tetratricopeptide (TPR) repeat protein/SAM-dependent methyltransferase